MEEPFYNPQVLARLMSSFYVDNVVTSVNDEVELKQFVDDSRRVMLSAGFDLRGWENSGDEGAQSTSVSSNVLGLKWNRATDHLSINFDCLREIMSEKISKRAILSASCKIFDPIGLLCPVLLIPKLLLQRIWKEKIDWDEEVAQDIQREFRQWYDELPLLQDVMIPRWLNISSKDLQNCEVHTFSDACQSAYAAATYLRAETSEGVKVLLLAAKSRVAPLKNITIPRLELLAATVGARLSTAVLDGLRWKNMKIRCWTDSSTALSWITRDEEWAIFVKNRVQEIRRLTSADCWQHIPGEYNPADLPSRGCSARKLVQAQWWEGPTWLSASSEQWPISDVHFDQTEIDRERKKSQLPSNRFTRRNKEANQNLVTVTCQTESKGVDDWYFHYFSNYERIVRMVGWMRRFIANCRLSNEQRLTGELSMEELHVAENSVVRLVQRESFEGEKDARLSSLKAFKDENGIIRLRTKIIYRADEADFRQPILLPSHHPVVERLILHQHKQHCHAGVQMLLNLRRERYWILNGRRTVRAVLYTCVVCRRQDSRKTESPTAPLPEHRIRDAAVFEVTGVDLAGPVFLKNADKAWICLFTCAIYRAVHLELVMSLSSEAFIQALRRFIARRGRPSVIYSDNGTNFVGTINAIRTVDWEEIAKFSTVHRIEWRFNPPFAAWWGGWWERLIRVMKRLLRKTLERAHLTYEEMTTILCDCEAVINSRPLTYVTENDAELVPLSPSLFLQDIKEIGVPEYDMVDSVALNRRLKYRQKIKRDLRNRFRAEYLGQLVQRDTGTNKKFRNVAVGDIVLVGTDGVKRLDWPLGRVIELLPGKDGVVRLVRVQTAHSTLLRPVQRIYSLEVSCDEPICRADRRQKANKSPSPVDVNPPLDVSNTPSSSNKTQITRSGRIVRIPQRLGI